MNIEMAMLPSMVREAGWQVCIVVDVLRATTTICTMFERGVREVYLGADTADVEAIAARVGDCLLAGEHWGVAPANFHLGNSPAHMLATEMAGQRIAFCTTNGTRALRELLQMGSPLVLAGCLRNGPAVAQAAYMAARRLGCGITVVASGRGHASKLALDDIIACGYIIYLLRQVAGLDEASQAEASANASATAEADDADYVADEAYSDVNEGQAEAEQRAAGARYPFVPYDAQTESSGAAQMAEEGAIMALRLYLSFVGATDPTKPSRPAMLAAFNESSSGHHLLRYGWAADTVAAAEAGVADIVPVVRIEGDYLVVRAIAKGLSPFCSPCPPLRCLQQLLDDLVIPATVSASKFPLALHQSLLGRKAGSDSCPPARAEFGR